MADLGYTVDTGAADAYTLPSFSSARLRFAAAAVHALLCEVEQLDVDF